MIVVDAWPLTTIIAGNMAASRGGNLAGALWGLCRAGEVTITPFQVEVITRFVFNARGGWATTPHVCAESFRILEACVGSKRLGEVIDWVRERMPEPKLVRVGWREVMDDPATRVFGPADASVLRAATKTRSTLLLQDGRLFAWCLNNGVNVRTCFDVAQVRLD